MDKLVCIKCDNEFSLNEKIWRCNCGGLLDIEFKPIFQLKKIKNRKTNMWRYREAIPIKKNENIISFEEGFTPLIDMKFNDKNVYVKQDHLFQTGSFKDRGASVLISKVKELEINKVIEDCSRLAPSRLRQTCLGFGEILCRICGGVNGDIEEGSSLRLA